MTSVDRVLFELDSKVNAVNSRMQVTERLSWGVLLGVIALVIKAYFVV